MSLRAKAYIGIHILAGMYIAATALPAWGPDHIVRFILYLAIACLASNLKVQLPGITGTLSVNFVFILISIMDLNLPQVLAVTCAGIAGQCLFRAKSRNLVQLSFNLSSSILSTAFCFKIYYSPMLRSIDSSVPLLLFVASTGLFLSNTLSISGVIALVEKKNVWVVWRDGFWWTASHHLVGAGVAAVFDMEETYLGWEAVVLTLPVIYFVYRSYSLHLGRLDAARQHARELGDLHWRTIEALALAIDAKDETTHSHLLRVKVYATEIGKELQLGEEEMQAVQAAALLHDIGKLAVPEHIISKPGKLTPEEFEKMKVHPVVGAEILERVHFPYPVVPIVRAHHEKWNGKGYPAGLRGEEIPVGARILAAVDCLDALASDRQYRRALPLPEAMAIVKAESGASFDPKIVEILERRYVELEHMATSAPCEEEPKLSKNIKVDAGDGPASGYADTRETDAKGPIDFVASIGAARQEFQSLLKVIEGLGSSLSVDETLALLTVRLKSMVPHETAAIFIREEKKLRPVYIKGEGATLFSQDQFPVGEGLTGWVVENRKPIVNGNPTVEHGYRGAQDDKSLQSALSVPLEVDDVAIGALTLYSKQPNAFTSDHLRLLLSISPKAALALTNALKHQQTAVSAATDDLTGLPNTKSLLLHMDAELTRAEQEHSSVAVLLVDLDGFKGVNDRFGHLTGNRVLQRISEQLQEHCRETDYVARIGGDEFVLVLRDVDPVDLQQLNERLNAAAIEVGRRECGYAIMSLSAGEAFYPKDGKNAEQLLARADQRMYRVKEANSHARKSFAEPPLAAAV